MSRCSPNLANYRTISMHFYAFWFRRRLRDLAHGSKPRIGNDAGLIFADCASDPYTDGRRTLGGAQFEQPRATTSKFVKAEALYFFNPWPFGKSALAKTTAWSLKASTTSQRFTWKWVGDGKPNPIWAALLTQCAICKKLPNHSLLILVCSSHRGTC